MFRLAVLLLVMCTASMPSAFAATEAPEDVATVVVHGFDPDGAVLTGTYGADGTEIFVANMAATLGLPMSTAAPLAKNQVAYTTYYGDTAPAYYTASDIADVSAVTAEHGGGVPRYATIIASMPGMSWSVAAQSRSIS